MRVHSVQQGVGFAGQAARTLVALALANGAKCTPLVKPLWYHYHSRWTRGAAASTPDGLPVTVFSSCMLRIVSVAL